MCLPAGQDILRFSDNLGYPPAFHTERAEMRAFMLDSFETTPLRVPIQNTYALEHAGEALADLANRHTQGKLALAIS